MESGEVVGRYKVIVKLGEGGFGEVWQAFDMGSGENVAIKIINGETSGDDRARRRFIHEILITKLVLHRQVPQIRKVGSHQGIPYFVMDFVGGVTLRSITKAKGLRWGPLLLIPVFRQVLDVLGHVHSKGVIHSDLKPDNIMVCGEDVRLLDFGLAKLLGPSGYTRSRVGRWSGTDAYASPEQISGSPLNVTSDIYSVGVMLQECLTGSRLTLPVGSVPGPLGASVERALTKSPRDRWQSAHEFRASLH